jgi:hypothetical protein
MRIAIPPLLNTPSWRGVQLKHRDKLYLYVLKMEVTEMIQYINTAECR